MPMPKDRLSHMISRLLTQRACLRFAHCAIADLPGPILEIGLGKGRTYDFLRTQFPDRHIFAFDRSIHCADDVRPDPDHLIFGELLDTLPEQTKRIGRTAALAHADIGCDDPSIDAPSAAAIGPLIDRLVQRQGLVLTDRPMSMPEWVSLPLPPDASDFPYYIYRVS